MYNLSTITQLGICKVKIEHNNKQKICNFFVVLGNRQALLGMLDIDSNSAFLDAEAEVLFFFLCST